MKLMLIVFFLSTYPNLDAIKYIETRNTPSLVGDSGKAYGVIQIHAIAVKEINRVNNTNFKHEEMFDVATSERFFFLYMDVCIKYYIKKEGKRPSEYDLVRMWNGGYTGYKKESTLKYLKKYKKAKKRFDK